jgi:hypothetical protein
MIGNLVSSILPGIASKATAERAPARPPDEDAGRAAMAAVLSAGHRAGKPDDAAVERGDPAGQVDYFHAAKHMLGKAMAGFRRDLRDAVAALGFGEELGGRLTSAVMHGIRDALLSGAGFSVKLMTATVSQTVSSGEVTSFSIAARSIDIAVNHVSGEVTVEAHDVAIRSQSSGAPGETMPHLLDIQDSGDPAPRGLMAALRALQNPAALFEDDGDEAIGPHRFARAVEPAPADDALPRIDTPAVLTRPGYTARIMVAAMEQTEDEHGGRITRLRLDAAIPLTGGSHEPAAGHAAGRGA